MHLEIREQTTEDIDIYLSEGKIVFKIQRFGLGKNTRYHATSVS